MRWHEISNKHIIDRHDLIHFDPKLFKIIIVDQYAVGFFSGIVFSGTSNQQVDLCSRSPIQYLMHA